MAGDITDSELIELFTEAGHRHHAAYADADGADPEWPLFYAAYVQTKLWDRLGVLLARSELVHVFVGSELAIRRGESAGEWPEVYATRLRAFTEAKAAAAR